MRASCMSDSRPKSRAMISSVSRTLGFSAFSIAASGHVGRLVVLVVLLAHDRGCRRRPAPRRPGRVPPAPRLRFRPDPRRPPRRRPASRKVASRSITSRSRMSSDSNSSRQMVIAWKVSGDSHRPAIIVLRPASMRLAMAISPSRAQQLDRLPISRRYIRTGSSVRSSFSLSAPASVISRLPPTATTSREGAALFLDLFAFLFLGDLDAHFRQHRHHVLDLVGTDLIGRQHRVQLVIGDVATLARVADHPLDRRLAHVERDVGVFANRLVRLVGVLGGHPGAPSRGGKSGSDS